MTSMVEFFPPPPAPIRDAVTELRDMAEPVPGETQAQATDRLDRLAELPRPWIPASCDPNLRVRLYRWLDEVAQWMNDQYSWQPKTMVPPCWPRHPHIVHELAVLAIQRHLAERTINPDAINEWHRYHRPLFTERMLDQLAEGCRNQHTPWAGRSRLNDFTAQRDTCYARFDAENTEMIAP